jgi:hypothetical protein
MWIMELTIKTNTAESNIGSQSDMTGTMGTSDRSGEMVDLKTPERVTACPTVEQRALV